MERRPRRFVSLPDPQSFATSPSSSRSSNTKCKQVGRQQGGSAMMKLHLIVATGIVLVAAVGFLCCIHLVDASHNNNDVYGRFAASGMATKGVNGASAATTTSTSTQLRTPRQQSLRSGENTSKTHRNDVLKQIAIQPPSSNNKTKTKPRFVWHVGVMKTGTTTIQTGLAAQRSLLQQDNWVFASQANKMFQKINQPDFVKRFQTAMDQYHREGKNVVLSNENFSVFYRSEDYRKIARVLGDDWDVTVVIGYRPYFEWIPSMWSQTFKLTRKEQSGAHPYTWTNRGAVPPIFPDYYEKIDSGPLFADSALQFVQPHFAADNHQIQLLHLYDPQGVHAKLVCDVLRAPRACAASRRQHEQDQPRVANRQGSLHPFYANAVATAAVNAGLVDPQRWPRLSVLQAIVAHREELALQQQQQNSSTTNSTTENNNNNNNNSSAAVYEWPMVCPSRADLERLWRQTLEKEARIFPALAALDPDRTATLRAGFEANIARQTYCSVDAERVLADWKDFFQQRFA